MNVILQSVYAGNVNYYAAILKSENVIVDIKCNCNWWSVKLHFIFFGIKFKMKAE